MSINDRPILENNIVINVILIDDALIPTWELPENQEFGPLGGNIGDTWNGTEYVKPFVPVPLPTVNDVENERKRRIMSYLTAITGQTYTWIVAYEVITDGTREAASLLNIKVKHLTNSSNPDWTLAQKQRAEELEIFNGNIDSITTKADALKQMNPIPSDYRLDKYWI